MEPSQMETLYWGSYIAGLLGGAALAYATEDVREIGKECLQNIKSIIQERKTQKLTRNLEGTATVYEASPPNIAELVHQDPDNPPPYHPTESQHL